MGGDIDLSNAKVEQQFSFNSNNTPVLNVNIKDEDSEKLEIKVPSILLNFMFFNICKLNIFSKLKIWIHSILLTAPNPLETDFPNPK